MYSSILLRNIWTDGEYTLEIVADFKVYTYKHIYFHIYWKSRLLRNQIAYLRVITKRQERPGFHLHLYDTGFTKPFLWGFFITVVCKSVGLNQKTDSSCGLFEWTKKQASLRTSVRTSDLPLGPSHLHFFDTPPLLSCPSSSCGEYSGVRAHEVSYWTPFFLKRFVVTFITCHLV